VTVQQKSPEVSAARRSADRCRGGPLRESQATDLPTPVRPSQPAGAYHRIDFAVSSIGFGEQHPDRIFQVFRRLHGRSDFAGTGIGCPFAKTGRQ